MGIELYPHNETAYRKADVPVDITTMINVDIVRRTDYVKNDFAYS